MNVADRPAWAGPATCVVTRDITAGAAVAADDGAGDGRRSTAPAKLTAAEAECNPFHTLRDRLLADAAGRLNVAGRPTCSVTFSSARTRRY